MVRLAVACSLILLACGATPSSSTSESGSPATSVASAPTATPTTSSAPSATTSSLDLLPEPTRLPASAFVTLAKYPEALSPRAAALLAQPSEDLQGNFLWARSFESKAPRYTAFTVHVAEGPIKLPVLDRSKSAPTHLVTTTTAALRFGRLVTIDSLTMGLGGPMVAATWLSPAGRYSILLLMELPPHDIPVSDKARAYYEQIDPAAVVREVALGIDPLLFPR